MNEQGFSETELRQLLALIGVSRFLRYRKRFGEQQIVREILSAEPDLTFKETEWIVMAGRRIVSQGMGLAALRLARSGDIDRAEGWLPSIDLRALGMSLAVNLGGVAVVAYLMLGLIWSAAS